ncbi:MAG: hypothetical protein KatS3mg132_807 [Limisphaera sp.]|nr:MAG: hypothetical protein KatS3mg132_807 [Limisphaera sp.]
MRKAATRERPVLVPVPPTGGRAALDLPFLALAKGRIDPYGELIRRKKTLPGCEPIGTVTGLVFPPG